MKKKTYTSSATLHFSVGGTRIAFTPLSSRCSYFETTDETLQERIEKHPWFGDKFRLKKTETTGETAAAAESGDAATQPEKKTELKEMSFSTLSDAKEWLADECGVPRSNIKTKADAVAAGLQAGVSITIGVTAAAADDNAGTGQDDDDDAF